MMVWNACDRVISICFDRLGDDGYGFTIAMKGLDGGRVSIGSCSLGAAQRCLDESIQYTRERVQFGKPLCDHQHVGFELADMAQRGVWCGW